MQRTFVSRDAQSCPTQSTCDILAACSADPELLIYSLWMLMYAYKPSRLHAWPLYASFFSFLCFSTIYSLNPFFIIPLLLCFLSILCLRHQFYFLFLPRCDSILISSWTEHTHQLPAVQNTPSFSRPYCMVHRIESICMFVPWQQTTKQTPWSESASELYRPSDRRLSAKWVPTFADKGCHVVGVTDPYGRTLDFLDRSRYFSIKYLLSCIHEAEWIPFQTHYFFFW
jgi:hypothetical protein